MTYFKMTKDKNSEKEFKTKVKKELNKIKKTVVNLYENNKNLQKILYEIKQVQHQFISTRYVENNSEYNAIEVDIFDKNINLLINFLDKNDFDYIITSILNKNTKVKYNYLNNKFVDLYHKYGTLISSKLLDKYFETSEPNGKPKCSVLTEHTYCSFLLENEYRDQLLKVYKYFNLIQTCEYQVSLILKKEDEECESVLSNEQISGLVILDDNNVFFKTINKFFKECDKLLRHLEEHLNEMRDSYSCVTYNCRKSLKKLKN